MQPPNFTKEPLLNGFSQFSTSTMTFPSFSFRHSSVQFTDSEERWAKGSSRTLSMCPGLSSRAALESLNERITKINTGLMWENPYQKGVPFGEFHCDVHRHSWTSLKKLTKNQWHNFATKPILSKQQLGNFLEELVANGGSYTKTSIFKIRGSK